MEDFEEYTSFGTLIIYAACVLHLHYKFRIETSKAYHLRHILLYNIYKTISNANANVNAKLALSMSMLNLTPKSERISNIALVFNFYSNALN